MDRKTRKVIAIAKQYIKELRKNKIHVTRAYLFGSYANGQPHKYSDIDLAIIFPQFTGVRFRDSAKIAQYCWNVDVRISPIGYHPKDFTMDYIIPHEAMTNGIRIA